MINADNLCLSTQLPQAVGAAYSLKMEKKDACAVTFCGDGGTSEVKKKMGIVWPVLRLINESNSRLLKFYLKT